MGLDDQFYLLHPARCGWCDLIRLTRVPNLWRTRVSLLDSGSASLYSDPNLLFLSVCAKLVGSSTQLLVLADHPKLQQFYACRLREHGYRVDLAGDIPSAVVAAIVLRPRLIIADWLLPGGHGGEFVRQLRSVPVLTNVPLLFLTEDASLPLPVHRAEGGRIDHLPMPFPFDRLLQKIEELLSGAVTSVRNVDGPPDFWPTADVTRPASRGAAMASLPLPPRSGSMAGEEQAVIEELMERGLLQPRDRPGDHSDGPAPGRFPQPHRHTKIQ